MRASRSRGVSVGCTGEERGRIFRGRGGCARLVSAGAGAGRGLGGGGGRGGAGRHGTLRVQDAALGQNAVSAVTWNSGKVKVKFIIHGRDYLLRDTSIQT
jgi:hypothetical protein